MGKRKRKSGGTKVVKLASWRPMTSLREARSVTSKFHAYTKELEALRSKSSKKSSTVEKNDSAVREREQELETLLRDIGGHERYQEASILLTRLNTSSSKWLFQNVTRLGLRPKRGEPPLNTLEVGAINAQLLNCPFLKVKAIDLKSRHPRIEQLDFFDLPYPPLQPLYDVVSNAMVLNCVPTAERRGEMLARCTRMLRLEGLLTIVLPIRCVKAIQEEKLSTLLQFLGLDVVHKNESPKISFWACVKKHSCWHHAAKSVDEAMEILLKKQNRKRSSPSTSEDLFQVAFTEECLRAMCTCNAS